MKWVAFDTMVANLGNPNLQQVEMGTVFGMNGKICGQDNVEGARRNIGGQIREQGNFVRGQCFREYYKDKKLQLFNKLIKLEQVLEVY